MNISNIINTVTNTLDSYQVPANTLPPLLLKSTSLTRPGLSAYKIAADIIKNNQKIGIPTGPNPDGSANLLNQFIYNLCKAIVNALQNDASIQGAIPLQSLLIQVMGANGGGPVTCTGTNLTDTIMKGIIQ